MDGGEEKTTADVQCTLQALSGAQVCCQACCCMCVHAPMDCSCTPSSCTAQQGRHAVRWWPRSTHSAAHPAWPCALQLRTELLNLNSALLESKAEVSALQQQKAALATQVEHQETHSHSLQSALTFKEQDWQQVRFSVVIFLACRGVRTLATRTSGQTGTQASHTEAAGTCPLIEQVGLAPCWWVSTCMNFTF